MPIRFPYFADLVRKEIMENMTLHDTFILSFLSERSKAMYNLSRSPRKLHLKYGIEGSYRLSRNHNHPDSVYENDFVTVIVKDKTEQKQGQQYEVLNILNQSVPIEIEAGFDKNITVYLNKSNDVKNEMLKAFLDFYPNMSIKIDMASIGMNGFRRVIDFVEALKVKLLGISVGTSFRTNDAVVSAVIKDCRAIKRFVLAGYVSPKVDINTTEPFKYDFIKINFAHWVTKDHFIRLLLDCKAVILEEKNYKIAELNAIFEEWAQGRNMEYLEICGRDDYYRFCEVRDVVQNFTNATPVYRVRLYNNQRETYELTTFDNERCFAISRVDGQQALIYEQDDRLCLSTKFQQMNIEIDN